MYDVIIVGAGPAGLMCANQIKNKKVLIIEKNTIAGAKLLLTGGGRCNLTNLKDNKAFLDNIDYNKKYLYSTISSFGPFDIYNFFNSKVPLQEESDNRIFPKSNKAKDIVSCLIEDISHLINYNEKVLKIEYNENKIKVITSKGEYLTTNLVIACGGSSFPKTGSDTDGV